MNLVRFAVNRPVTTFMFFIALTLLGLFSYSRLAIDLYPDLSFPTISVSTSYSGVAPEEIESLITIPIEQALSTISGVTGMSSTSRVGSSRVTLTFNWGTDLETAMNEVRANLDRVRSRLPDGASDPRVGRYDPNQSPIMTLGVSGNLDQAELLSLVNDEIVYYFERLDGVAAVNVQGGRTREIRIELDPLQLQANGLTIDQVVQAIQGENLNTPAGRLFVGQAQYTLRTIGEFRSADELNSVVVANRNGVQMLLKDIATIDDGGDNQDMIVRVDGKPGVIMSIQKQSDANTVQVADAVYRTMEELRRRYPEINVRSINDSSTFIRLTVQNVVNSGLIGGLLAGLILLIFLRSIRSTLIVGIAIPVSIVSTFILIEQAGMTLNSISLGGLALGIGMLFDNSIVVLENIYRHRKLGKDAKTAAIDGTSEMITAVTASTLTTVAVFLPLMYVTGMTGLLFRQLALMVIFSLTCSLLVAITLLPVMCAKIMGDSQTQRKGIMKHIDERLAAAFARQEEAYGGLIKKALAKPGLVAVIAIVIFAISLCLYPLLGTEFMPTTDEGNIFVSLSLPTGTLLEVTDEMAQRVEGLIRDKVPELANMETQIGRGGYGGSGTHSASISMTLVPRSERKRSTDEIVTALQKELAAIPELTSRVYSRGGFGQRMMSMNFGGGGGDRITLNIQGPDRDVLSSTARQIQELIAEIPGITNVGIRRDQEQPEFVLKVNRQRAADLGLSTRQIASAVQTAMQGRVATRIQTDGREQSVRVVLAGSDSFTPADIEALPISIGGGRHVLLRTVASLETRDSPAAIERLDQKRNVTITASMEGRDLGGTVAKIQEAVGNFDLPEGVTVHYGGEYEEQQKAFRELLYALLLAIAMVYIVMASQFESLFDPFIVMFSIPFALVGVIWILFLTNTPVNTQAYVGLIMLGGIVVNNAIVLISYINMLREQGVSLDEAVVRGASTRLQPIFMTTGTTVLGMVPLALGIGEGSEIQVPLARTVIGGLIVSTVVTLVLIPTLYHSAHKFFQHRRSTTGGLGTKALIFLVLCGLLAFDISDAAEHKLLTVNEAIEAALKTNIELKAVENNYAATESRFRQLQAGYKPNLSLDSDWGYSDSNLASGQTLSLSLSARQVFNTGTILGWKDLDLTFAQWDLHYAKRELEQKKQQVALNTLAAYIEVLKAQSNVRLTAESLQRTKAAVAQVQFQVDQGMASTLALQEAKLLERRRELALAAGQQRLRIAKGRLNQELNAEPFSPLMIQEISLNWPGVLAEFAEAFSNENIPSSDLETALSGRLEVVKARLDLKKAEEQAQARVSGLVPRVGVSANLNHKNLIASLTWNDRDRNNNQDGDLVFSLQSPFFRQGSAAGTSSKPSWSIGVQATWQLYEAGQEKEQKLQEELRLENLRETVTQRERSAIVDVQEAYFTCWQAFEQVKVTELEYDNHKTRLRQAEQRAEIGVATQLELLDEQLLLLEAEQALVEAKWNALLASLRYRLALGLPVWPLGAQFFN